MATRSSGSSDSTVNLYYCQNVQIGTNNIINYKHTRSDDDSINIEEFNDPEADGLLSSRRPFSSIKTPLPFVGRKRETEIIKAFLKSERNKSILQIIGPAMVGKKSLAKKVLSSMQDEPTPWQNPAIMIPCNRVTSWKDFLNTFAAFCKIKPVAENVLEVSHIVSFKDKFDRLKPVILLTNCERLKLTTSDCGNKFQHFLNDLLDNCQSTKIVVTSQQFFEFEEKSDVIQLQQFSKTETLAYLEELLPEDETEEYHAVILERCYGLPTYIRDAAFLIRDNLHASPLTSDELRTLLQDESRTSRLRHDPAAPIDMTLAQYISSIPPEHHQNTLDLSILKGSFGLEAIQAVLGKSSGEVKHTVSILCKNSVLDRVNGDSALIKAVMFQFNPQIATSLNQIVNKHIKYNDVARLRFVNYFGSILLQINSNLYLPSRQSLYGYDPKNWSHLESLLREAVHCTDSTYEAFKQVALKADNIIINCFPNESIEFYEMLMNIADRVGSPRDVGALKAQLARALTVNQGVQLKRARKLFLEAVETLEEYGPSDALICLKRDLSFNYFKDAQYRDAARSCEEAIELGRKIDTLDNMMISRLLSARSLAAINYNILGEHKKAENIILETLELAREFSSSHASIYVMLNTLGIIHENINKDDDKALKYYKASLHERRKYEEIVPQELIISLNYVGMQYSKREENEKGLKYLEEAADICTKCKICDEKAGLTYLNLGTINMKLMKYEVALKQFEESIKIYSVCGPTQRSHISLRLMVSHFYILLDKVEDSKAALQECSNYSVSLSDQVPDSDCYLLALGHLIPLVQSSRQLCVETMKVFLKESKRLLTVLDHGDKRVVDIKMMMLAVENCLRNFHERAELNVEFSREIQKICHVCEGISRKGSDISKCWDKASAVSEKSSHFNSRLLGSFR